MSPTCPCFRLALLLTASAWAPAQEDARLLMLQARALQLRGGGDDPKGAVELYRKVAAKVPQSAEAQLRLSESLAESGDADAAVEPAIRATELNPRNGEAFAHLGLLQLFRSRTSPELLPQAEKAIRQATRLIPNDAELQFRLAGVCESQKKQPQALKAWLRLARMNPAGQIGQNQPLALYAWDRTLQLATELDQYETRREAIMALGQRRHQTEDLRALESMARDQVAKGYLGHAEESFLLLGRYYPQEPAIWENITILQLRTNRFDEGLRSLQQAEALHKTPRITLNIGICLLNLGRLQEAEARFRSLLDNPAGLEQEKGMLGGGRALLATTLMLQERPKEMLDLLKGWPEEARAMDLLALQAQAQIQTKNWKAARLTLKEGIKRFPDRGIFREAAALSRGTLEGGLFSGKESRRALTQLDRESMANLWAEFRQWEPCLKATREAHGLSPSRSVDLLLLEANALEQLDRPVEAEAVLREAQKIAPANATLQNNLGYNLLERDVNLDEAASLIESANRLEPSNGSFVDSLGWAQFKQGKLAEAEKTLRKAVELNANSPECLKHFGEVLLKLDRPQEALAQWERAMAYVFPDRKELEKRIRDLRVLLAKREAALDPEDALPPDDSDAGDPGFDDED